MVPGLANRDHQQRLDEPHSVRLGLSPSWADADLLRVGLFRYSCAMQPRLLLLLPTVLSASCQTSEGLVFQSGTSRSSFSAGWDASEVEDSGSATEVTTLQASAQTGAFLNSTMEIGLDLDYFDQEDGNSNSNSMGIALYGRYWFQQKGNARAWAEASAGYANIDLDEDSDGGLSWSGSAGISQFLTPSTALEASLRYANNSYDLASGPLEITSTSLLLGYAIFY